jgi:hypothetical protein
LDFVPARLLPQKIQDVNNYVQLRANFEHCAARQRVCVIANMTRVCALDHCD